MLAAFWLAAHASLMRLLDFGKKTAYFTAAAAAAAYWLLPIDSLSS